MAERSRLPLGDATSFLQQRSYTLFAIAAAGIVLTTWAICTLQKRLSE